MNTTDRIEEIWNSNAKIPFMQSKDILRLGYEYGNGDCRDEFLKNKSKKDSPQPKSESQSYINTTNGFREKAAAALKDEEKFIANNAKLELVQSIMIYMDGRSYMELYDYLSNLKKKYKQINERR